MKHSLNARFHKNYQIMEKSHRRKSYTTNFIQDKDVKNVDFTNNIQTVHLWTLNSILILN